MDMTRILITVKTYPTLSTKYGELVRTAGLTDEGDWVRLYPIPFRLLDYTNRFSKWTFIELPIVRNRSDFRKESYRPIDPDKINLLDELKGWKLRASFLVDKAVTVNTNMETLIKMAKSDTTSLSFFRPKSCSDIVVERSSSAEWDSKKVEQLEQTKGAA